MSLDRNIDQKPDSTLSASYATKRRSLRPVLCGHFLGKRGLSSLVHATVRLFAIFLSVGVITVAADNQTSGIVGVWDTGDGAHVEIYERDGKYHGKFLYFYDEPPASGIDAKNPDPALRNRSLVGTDFLLNFEFTDQKWKNGRIYNPENGKLYKADLELRRGVLRVRGWIGFRLLGRTVEWTSLD